MKTTSKAPVLAALAAVVSLSTAGCAGSRAAPDAEAPLVSPADLLASLADVANGRNADMAESGLVLKSIDLTLAVGREDRGGVRVSFVVLDIDASRRSDVTFTQSFTFELPAPDRRRAIANEAAMPGVTEFIDAAMASARELSAAAARAGLPQKLSEVELVARIVRSTRAQGGIAFTGLGIPGTSFSGGAGRSEDRTNTVRLRFIAR